MESGGEVDKKINDLVYSKENCVLACYYCNNDKSYTVNDEVYKPFLGPARNCILITCYKQYSIKFPVQYSAHSPREYCQAVFRRLVE